jgi:hypothetical protein
MRRIVLINSYCDTQEKIDVLLENLNILKSAGLDTFLYSPILLPNNIIECCSYFMYNKNNPILHFPEKGVFCYNVSDFKGKRYTIRKMLKDYGWANLYQFKKLSEVALTFDYTHFYNIIYDLIIDDNIINNIFSDKECNFFKFHEHDVSLHFMIFNRENLQKFLPSLTLENYLSDKSNFAEKFLHKVLKSNFTEGAFEDVYVEDKIFYYGKDDQFNYSKIDGIKYFIIKDYYNRDSIKFYFYQLHTDINITIKISDINKEFKNIVERELIDLGIANVECLDIIIEFDDIKYSVKEQISDIVHNTIEITDL